MTPVIDAETRAASLRADLVRHLVADGLLKDSEWKRAVERVPRHRFVPGFFRQTTEQSPDGLAIWEPLTEAIDQETWLSGAYSDATLITQFDGDEPEWSHPARRIGGAPTSSSTLPSLVVQMWQDAELDDGDSVLEIGTGTGYSTALACERLGDDGSVVSVEVDPDRLDQAANALFGSGYQPTLAVADGLYGYEPEAPFDRIVAACSVRSIPSAWLRQTKPGGTILTTLGGWLYGYARAHLTVNEDGSAEGPLLPGTISFMAARAQEAPPFGNPQHWAQLAADVQSETAHHDPARITEATETAFFARFLAQLAAPDAQLSTIGDTTFVVDLVSGSVAVVSTSSDGLAKRQAGPLRLWDVIEEALDKWDDVGQPGPEAFRMHCGTDGQQISATDVPSLSFSLP